MTSKKIARPRASTKLGQAGRILEAFSDWLEASPGRRVILERAPDGWRSTLVEGTERPATGSTLTDAAAQSAMVCNCEAGQ